MLGIVSELVNTETWSTLKRAETKGNHPKPPTFITKPSKTIHCFFLKNFPETSQKKIPANIESPLPLFRPSLFPRIKCASISMKISTLES